MPDQGIQPRGLSDSASLVLMVLAVGVGLIFWGRSPEVSNADAVETSTLVCPFGYEPNESGTSEEAQQLLDQVDKGKGEGPRIVALMPFAADQLLELGVVPAGVPSLRGPVPESWKGIPTVQLDHSVGPNLEQLISCQPDVIITPSTYLQFVDVIRDMTGAEVVVMDVASIDDVFENIRRLGAMTGVVSEAERWCDSIQSSLKQKVSRNGSIDVLAIFGTPHSFYAFLPNSYLGDLVRYAGGQVGPSELSEHRVYKGLAPLTMESVVEYDPDALLVLFHGPEDSSRAMFENDPLWSTLRVIQEGRVKYLSDDLYAMRPGSDLNRAINEIQNFLGNHFDDRSGN